MDAVTKQLKIAQLKQKIASAQARLSGHQTDFDADKLMNKQLQ